SPGDALEQEADQVAAKVMRMPAPIETPPAPQASAKPLPLASSPLASSSPASISTASASPASSSRAPRSLQPIAVSRKKAAPSNQVKGRGKTAKPAARKAKPTVKSPTPLPHGLPARLSKLEQGGEPLSKELRAFFEPRFDADLGHVRIHRGAEPDQMAREVDARAFTVGHHIVFADDSWHPNTEAGRQLLAHELAHVQQQSAHGIHAISRAPRCQGILDASIPQSVGGGQSPIDGVKAHELITAQFIRDNGVFRRLRIPAASSSPYRTEECSSDVTPSEINPLVYNTSPRSAAGQGIPDLLLWKAGTVELGEIKPATWGCLTFAEDQVRNYVDKGNEPFNAAYRKGRGINQFSVMPMSSWTQLPLRLQDSGNHLLVDWCSPGVVGYLGVKQDDANIFVCGLNDQARLDKFIDGVLARARLEIDRVVNAYVNGLIGKLMSNFSLREVLKRIGGEALASTLPPDFEKTSLGQQMEAYLRQQIQLAKDKFITQLQEKLKQNLRQVLQNLLNTLCAGALAVSVDQLMAELRKLMQKQLPVAAIAVAMAMVSAMMEQLQKAIADFISEYGGVILGIILAIVAVIVIIALVADDATGIGVADDALIAPMLALLARAAAMMRPLLLLLSRVPAIVGGLLGPAAGVGLPALQGAQ
ncbi:MAG: DUF4157 domain-containing protein, partial [Acidobacteria bacterium]|nr:DUF4157 domain-containing protein [Acidobacteriota bacterium]